MSRFTVECLYIQFTVVCKVVHTVLACFVVCLVERERNFNAGRRMTKI